MKRLTEYTIPETGFSVVSEEKYKRILMEEKPSVEKVYNRLKKIEDILGDEYDLERLRELTQADKQERCMVLPCDPGQIVWAVNSLEVSSHQIRQLVRGKDGDFACSLLKFPFEDFGRKVFLTREEAVAALRREQE